MTLWPLKLYEMSFDRLFQDSHNITEYHGSCDAGDKQGRGTLSLPIRLQVEFGNDIQFEKITSMGFFCCVPLQWKKEHSASISRVQQPPWLAFTITKTTELSFILFLFGLHARFWFLFSFCAFQWWHQHTHSKQRILNVHTMAPVMLIARDPAATHSCQVSTPVGFGVNKWWEHLWGGAAQKIGSPGVVSHYVGTLVESKCPVGTNCCIIDFTSGCNIEGESEEKPKNARLKALQPQFQNCSLSFNLF